MAELPVLRIPLPEVERNLHKAAEKAREAEFPRHGLRLSTIGACTRWLWAGLQGVPEEREIDPRVLLLFRLGHVIETHVIELLRDAGYVVQDRDPRTGGQMEITAHEGRSVGHLDGKVVRGRKGCEREALLEIKSAKASRFEELLGLTSQGKGYHEWNPVYYDQVQAYMGYAGLNETMVVVYCKDDSRIYAEVVKLDLNRFKLLDEKARYIHDAETIPDRPEAATSQYCAFCKYCSRNAWCWSSTSEVRFDD